MKKHSIFFSSYSQCLSKIHVRINGVLAYDTTIMVYNRHLDAIENLNNNMGWTETENEINQTVIKKFSIMDTPRLQFITLDILKILIRKFDD